MKLRYAYLVLALAIGPRVEAQTPAGTTTPTFIDIGNIRAPHYPVGDMWWDPAKNYFTGMEYPHGDTGQVQGFGGIIFGGRDENIVHHIAGNFYRDPGTDFQPGPIVAGDSARQANSAGAWGKIWKVNSTDIDLFLNNRAYGVPGIPQSILEWPGKENPFAKGFGGAGLTLNRDFAPFVDVNSDGKYNPYDGDYPKMKGSQMLWWMFNDHTSHPLTRTAPVDAEISASAYAYSTGTLASNIIFYEYEITNRGAALSDFHFGLCAELDVAHPFTDFLGMDSVRRLGLVYNGMTDSPGVRGNSAAVVLLVEQPGDSRTLRTPLRNIGLFDTWARTAASIYSDLSQPQWSALPWNAGLDWECLYGKNPGNRSFTLSSGARSLPANGSLRYAYALFMADSAMACPRPWFGSTIETADTAFERYWHPSRVTPGSNPTSVGPHITAAPVIYPNPAERVLHILTPISNPVAQVRNAIGGIVNVDVRVVPGGLDLQTSSLPPGIYHLQLRSATGSEVLNSKFVKH